MPERFAGDGKLSDLPAAAPPAHGLMPASPVLEFDIDPADVKLLLRAPILAALRHGRAHTTKLRTVWHDTPGQGLRGRGLSLAEQGGYWRLERLAPDRGTSWLPAAPAPVVAEAASAADLETYFSGTLSPVAAFAGTRRSFPLAADGEPARLDVVQGDLRGVAHDEPACRVVLSGDGPAMAGLALELAGHARLSVPRAGLAARAMALASGTQPMPRRTGGPQVMPGQTVDEALVLITGHLADVVLHWSRSAADGASPEPVHQMRVAVRRLRTALSIFRRAAPHDAADGLAAELKTLAGLLGAARDWDVFLTETGVHVQAAFPQDRRVAGLLAAAGKRRLAAYAGLRVFVNSAGWRQLALRLALLPTLRPWALRGAGAEHPDMLGAPVEAYAAQALHRAFKTLLSAGDDLSALDAFALHEVRKQAKKLRYTTEFFAPLFPVKSVKRFVEKLVDLQESLGGLNDAAVAAELTHELAGGAERAFAAGVVQGYMAATTTPAARHCAKAWRKLAEQDRFWA